MITYPKIESLYKRDKTTFTVIPSELRCPEFGLIKDWQYTEKIDGQNIRICIKDGEISYRGRTDNAEFKGKGSVLIEFLKNHLPITKFINVFDFDFLCTGLQPEIVLFGEGYGPGIQKIGKQYRKEEPSFRLFDVNIGGVWLDWPQVEEIAAKMDVKTAPILPGGLVGFPRDEFELKYIIGTCDDQDGMSKVAYEESGNFVQAEGIIARPYHTLLNKYGQRVMWKLKFSDFRGGKR